ncbi:MAG: DNA adenine methylase [Collinsella sp.]
MEASPKAVIVYLDPPYTKRQCASYCHIPETIAYHDEPAVEGVAKAY